MFELNNAAFRHILHIQHVCLDHRITYTIGPSGSGKAVMLCLSSRLNEVEQGTILCNGKDIQRLNPMKLWRRVVMLGRTPVIYPGDIEESLQIGLQLDGRLPATKQKLEEYLEEVGLHRELQKSCEHPSGGEKQRLCLAQMMLADAEVYLVDEPSSTLDKETESSAIGNLVHFVTERKRQSIMITHSVEVSAR